MPLFGKRPKQRAQRDLLVDYATELDRSRAWRDSEGFDDLWEMLVDMYRGKGIIPSGASEDDRIAINQAFSTINVIYPAVSVAFPKFDVLATKNEAADRAVFAAALLNYQWDHYGFHEPFREAVKDSLIVGHGWAKTLWTYEESDHEPTEEEFAESFQVGLRDEAATADREDRELRPDEEIARDILKANTVTITDRPVIERISPHDMYVNPEATSMRDARWVAQRVIRTLDDVQQDTAYIKSARMATQPGLTMKDKRYVRAKNSAHEAGDLVEVWEFYDLRRGTMCVFNGDGSEFLIRPRNMPFTFGHPFEFIGNYDVPDHFYPVGDLEMIAPLIRELSKTRSEMLNHRARYARKYVARKSAINRNDLHKIASKKDGEVIWVEDDSVQLNDVIQPVQQIPMDPGLYNWSEQITGDITDISGVSEFARGGTSSVRRTATEASLLQDAQNARSAEKLDGVESFLAKLAKSLLQINQQFMTGQQTARVIGREGAALFVPMTREDIKGAFDYKVEAGSTQPKNESFRRQSALALMQTLAPFIELQQINVPELLRHVLRDGFGVTNPEKFLTQQQQPQQQDPNAVPQQVGGAQGADAAQLEPQAQADANVAAELQPALGG